MKLIQKKWPSFFKDTIFSEPKTPGQVIDGVRKFWAHSYHVALLMCIAFKECVSRLKPGGVFVAAIVLIMDACIL